MVNFLYAILLLGLVIFVHEFGHFLVARRFGVKILVFSLGFGPPLFSWRRGETEYRISAVPLGGYVKMLGEQTTEEDLPPEDVPRSFVTKRWWEKTLIVLAGPLMNFVFAAFVYLVVSFFNYTSDAALVEYVTPDSPAMRAGIGEGDRILFLNGEETAVWEDVQNALPRPDGERCPPIQILLARFPDNRPETVMVEPEKKWFSDVLGTETARCIIGIAALPRDTRLALLKPVEPLRNGDLIRAVDKKPVYRWYEFLARLTEGPHELTIERNGDTMTVTLASEETASLRQNARHGGMLVASVDPDSVAAGADIRKNDLVLAVNGIAVGAPHEFAHEMKKSKEGSVVSLTLLRNGEEMTKEIRIAFDTTDNRYTGLKETSLRWGARFFFDYTLEPSTSRRSAPLLYSLRYMISETAQVSALTVKGIAYLLSGKLSAKSLGGPILVFDISQKAAERGIKTFLSVMAMISINLGILNLFPIPVLDGGHAAMYTYEGVTRRTIPPGVKEWSLRIGVVFLMALMVFAIFNDVSRYLSIFQGG